MGANAIESRAAWLGGYDLTQSASGSARAASEGAQRAAVASAAGRRAAGSKNSWLVNASCRALDLVGSAVLLIVLAPLLLALAIAVRLDSPGPAFFRQLRLGRDRRPFTVYKFRTMHDGVAHDEHRKFVLGLISGETPAPERSGAPASAGPHYKMTRDLRVTRFGRMLRRTSLDELPQLWNVLRGEMSLVGPRPPIPYEVEHYPPHWFARFAVKPGITGLWQVNGRSEVPLEEMVRLDIEYAQRRSLGLNLLLLARTIPAVLSGRGAS